MNTTDADTQPLTAVPPKPSGTHKLTRLFHRNTINNDPGLPPGVTPSHFTVRKMLREVWIDLTSRLTRTILTALGTTIGIAVLIATLGLADSASANITTHFDELAATHLTVSPTTDPREKYQDPGAAPDLPFDADIKAARINGVESASLLTPLDTDAPVAGLPIATTGRTDETLIMAASPDLPHTLETTVTGRFFDPLLADRADPVAVLGENAARTLGVTTLQGGPVVFVNHQPLTVIGILAPVFTEPDLNKSVIVSNPYATTHLGLTTPTVLHVRTRIGAADTVGSQTNLAIRPDNPDLLTTKVPPTPTITRDAVAGDTQALLVALAAISLLVGGIGIANVTLVSVIERTHEIGLRRTLGATKTHILTQFLTESAITGLLGALAGTSAGILATVTVATTNGWPPIINPTWPLLAPLIGAAIGLLAGIYPAQRAAHTEPITALRTNN